MYKIQLMLILGLLALVNCTNNEKLAESTDATSVPRNCPSCDLKGHDFSGLDLTNANFLGANLDEANFSNAILDGAIFSNASLKGAIFKGASIKTTSDGPAVFNNADLSGARFNQTLFEKTEFPYALLIETLFLNSNLSTVIFGPRMKFSEAGTERPPIFDNVVLSCEFPWLWPKLKIKNSKLPDCENFLEGSTEITLIEKYRATPPGEETATSTVYVSANSGTDSLDCGTPNSPCKTIMEGISKCLDNTCDVLVAYGEYYLNGSIDIKPGVNLYGGLVNWEQTVYQSALYGAKDGTPVLLAADPNNPIKMSNFILNGSTSNSSAKASIVISIDNNTTLTLEHVNINAGRGYNGRQGATGPMGQPGRQGGQGNPGEFGGPSYGAEIINSKIIAREEVVLTANAGGTGGQGGTGGAGTPGGTGGHGGNGGNSFGLFLIGSNSIEGTITFYEGSSTPGAGGEGGTGINCSNCKGATGTPGKPGQVKYTYSD